MVLVKLANDAKRAPINACDLFPADVWGIIARMVIISNVFMHGCSHATTRRLFYVCRAWYYATYHNTLFWHDFFASYPAVSEYIFPPSVDESITHHIYTIKRRLLRPFERLFTLGAGAPLVAVHALMTQEATLPPERTLVERLAELIHEALWVVKHSDLPLWQCSSVYALASLWVYASHYANAEAVKHARFYSAIHDARVPIIYNFTVEPTTRTQFDPVSPDNINWHVADYVAAHYNFAMSPETERYWPTPELDKYIVCAIDRGQAWRARVPLLHAVCKPSDASWFWNWTAFKPTSEHSSRSRADYRALCDELVRERGLRYANVEDGVCCDLRERIECAHYEPEHSRAATSIYEAYLHHDPLGLLPCVIARYDTLQAAAGWWWSKGCLERPGHYATLRDAALVQLEMLKQQQQQQQQQKRSDAPNTAVSPTKRTK